jgi:stage II sporulation protein M
MDDQEPGTPPETNPAPAERRPGFVRKLYRAERAMWKAHYRRYFIIAARVLALGFVLGFIYFLLWPAQEKKALAFVMKSLKDIPLGAQPLILALTIFYHNTWASLVAVAAGIVPLVCFPILDPLLNGAVIGLLASLAKHQGLNVPLLFLKGIAPHGVFELTAVLYATSAGIYLSLTLWEHIRAGLARAREDGKGADGTTEIGLKCKSPLVCCLVSVARSFLLVVLPLLVIAAFIEAFITPHM